MPKSTAELVENWKHNIRLGLDLKGGSHLVLQVQIQDAFKAEADSVIQRMRDELTKANVGFGELMRNDPQTLQTGRSDSDRREGHPCDAGRNFRQVVNDNFGGVWNHDAGESDGFSCLTMKPSEALKLRQDTLSAEHAYDRKED